MNSKNIRNLHPFAKWDDEMPTIEIDTHPAEPFDDPGFALDDGLDDIPEVVVDTHERETAEVIELTSTQLYQRRQRERAHPEWW